MSATDVLRRMLDERGVDWVCYGDENHTWWNSIGTFGWYAEERPSSNGLFVKLEAVITPEQAIAATLNSRAERTCKFTVKDNMNETEGMGDVWIECSACHCVFDYFADDWLMAMNYCPSCGARKVNK